MRKFILIAGPCGLENETYPMETCETILRAIEPYPSIKYIFKSSWTKANRTSGTSYSGLSFDDSMKIFTKVKETFNVPILTDVHETQEVKDLEPFIDYLQIPAFLSRQTALIQEAAKSKPINIKKGQFMSPYDMKYALAKAKSVSNNEVFLCERGTSFGYNQLVVDFTSIPIMQAFGAPVILDATHCLQRKISESETDGQRWLIPYMCRLGVAANVDGLFIETHPDVSKAKSDAGSQLELKNFKALIDECMGLI